VRQAALLGLATQVVAVVEEDRAQLPHQEQGLHLRGHRGPGPAHVFPRILRAQRRGLVERETRGHVAVERIVRGGLVGGDVHAQALLHQPRVRLRRVAMRPRSAAPAAPAPRRTRRRPRPGRGSAGRSSHPRRGAGRGPRPPRRPGRPHRSWSPPAAAARPHAAEPGGQHEPARRASAKMAGGAFAEGLERALDDALRADVDPRAAVILPATIMSPCPRAPRSAPTWPSAATSSELAMSTRGAPAWVAEDTDRLARLDQQRSRPPPGPAASSRSARRPPRTAPPCRGRRRPRSSSGRSATSGSRLFMSMRKRGLLRPTLAGSAVPRVGSCAGRGERGRSGVHWARHTWAVFSVGPDPASFGRAGERAPGSPGAAAARSRARLPPARQGRPSDDLVRRALTRDLLE